MTIVIIIFAATILLARREARRRRAAEAAIKAKFELHAAATLWALRTVQAESRQLPPPPPLFPED